MQKIHRLSKKVTIILSIALCFSGNKLMARKGIVIVPIADLAGQPIHTYYAHEPLITAYHKLPWAHYRNDYEACPRVHQLLYHEIVDIIGQRNNELLIKIPNIFYQTVADMRPQTYYWTLTSNILPASNLPKKAIDLTKLPAPIYFNKNNDASYADTVSLIEPYTDETVAVTFSAGTRFLKTKEQSLKDKVMVYCLHPKTHTICAIALPRSSVYIFTGSTLADRVTDFLAIVRRWTNQDGGFIPYVWGGCSFTDRYAKNEFGTEKALIQGKTLRYYTRPENKVPKQGYDCSSIIARAAQIVGLPYYYKNTYTIAKQLPLLSAQEKLKNGDLIWIRGHILIVANCQQHTVIEASAYDYGYGEVHEIPICKVFKGIETLDDLQRYSRHKKPVERLHRNGTVLDTYTDVKLLKFASQWA